MFLDLPNTFIRMDCRTESHEAMNLLVFIHWYIIAHLKYIRFCFC